MSRNEIEFVEGAEGQPIEGHPILRGGFSFQPDPDAARQLTVKVGGRALGSCCFSRPGAPAALEASIFIREIHVADEGRAREALSLLLYGVLRRGRISGAKTFVMNMLPEALAAGLGSHVQAYPPSGRALGHCGWIDRSMLALHDTLPEEQRAALEPFHVDEIVQTVKAWIGEFYQCRWGRAVRDKTLTREQYIRYLYDIHCFVRQTTQHLARAVEISPNIELRNHFIEHLKGEINHELWIESDLENLGVDPTYLRESYLPSTAVREFMAMQETLTKFYQDPVVFMACPLVAEGTAAMMTPDFIESLEECIRSWGVEKPARAMTFTRSHMITDAGTDKRDGHWILTARMVGRYVKSERQLQKFLSFMRAIMDTYRRGTDQCIEDSLLWSREGQSAAGVSHAP
jgi:thiaminase